ncbi:MAG: nicotinamide-nucleotide adenylyltransferase, partial [Candidatus Bathyarchaeia archaeon]
GYKVNDLPLFDRKVYISTLIRENMIKNKNWTTLVPKAVATFIDEIDGVNRLKDLAQSDRIC